MKLYFKNLLNVIRKSPFQPLMIILVLSCSATILMTAFSMRTLLIERERTTEAGKYGKSDIRVYFKDNTDHLFFFDEPYKDLIGDNGEIYSFFSCPMRINNQKLIDTIAIDIEGFAKLNTAEMIETETATLLDIEEAAYISQAAAEELGLSVGDEFASSFLGEPLTFVVKGIAENKSGIFCITDMVVAKKKLIQRLISDSDMYFAQDMGICTGIYIFINDKNEVPEWLEKTELMSENYLNVSMTKDVVENSAHKAGVSDIIIYLFSIMSSLISILVILSMYSVFVGKRIKDIILFRTIGASPNTLSLLLLSESFIYSLIGCAVSIPLSQPFIKMISDSFHINYSTTLHPEIIPFVFICTLLSCFIALLRPIKKIVKDSSREELQTDVEFVGHKIDKILIIAFIGIFLLLLPVYFLIKYEYYYVLALIAICLSIVTTHLAYPYLLSLFSFLIEKAISKKKNFSFPMIAFKTAKKNTFIISIGRTMMVGLVVIFIIFSMLTAATEQITLNSDLLDFDCVMMVLDGKSEQYKNEIAEMEGVATVGRCYFNYHALNDANGGNVLAFEGELSSYLDLSGTGYREEGALQGNEVIITTAIAKINHAKIGDELTFFVAERAGTYVVKQIIDIAVPMIFVNAEYACVPYNKLVIRYSQPRNMELTEKLEEKYGQRLCFIIDKSFVMNIDEAETTVVFGKAFMIVVAITVLVSILNDILDMSKKSREKRALYSSLGVNKKDFVLYSLCEISVLLLTTAVLFTVAFVLVSKMIEIAALSWGIGLHLI